MVVVKAQVQLYFNIVSVCKAYIGNTRLYNDTEINHHYIEKKL